MPTLDWIGKKAVLNHHREVPYRLLHCDRDLSAGNPDAGNLVVQGDNLEALKALLPYYGGQVKCIYIDPPYNTGNENWVYNDAVNSPGMREWLGKVVGRDDLSRRDKWLCMMYPRLALLREFLSEDGAIFISIDDNELASLRWLLDEIMGERSFVATVIWQKVYSPKNSARHFSEDHDYIVVYAKNPDLWIPKLVPRTEIQDRRYKNPDDDPRGPWKTVDLSARNPYSRGIYSIECPSGRVIDGPPRGRYWQVSEDSFAELDRDNRIWWGKTGNAIPQIKRFLSEVKQGRVPQTFWPYTEVGHTDAAKKELKTAVEFADSESVFITPKPLKLLDRILTIATERDSLVLDSFAGTGTTGHAVFRKNSEDGGCRRFILVEVEESVCKQVTSKRLQSAIAEHKNSESRSGSTAEHGPGFRFCRLGNNLFDESGDIGESVKFSDLAAHIFFSETGLPLPKRTSGKSPLLGCYAGKAVYLLFNGVMGDKRPQGGNVLTSGVLKILPAYDGARIVYAEGCRLSPQRLKREGVVFRQIPYEVKVR